MTIPSNVKIGALYFDVKQVDELKDEDSEDIYGQVDHFKQEFTLRKDVTEEIKKVTLLHEIIHVFDEYFSLGLSEGETDQLAFLLHMVLKENEGLL